MDCDISGNINHVVGISLVSRQLDQGHNLSSSMSLSWELSHSKQSFWKVLLDDCFYLFSDPLGNKIVAKDDDGGTGNKPESVETEERVIETTLKKKQNDIWI